MRSDPTASRPTRHRSLSSIMSLAPPSVPIDADPDESTRGHAALNKLWDDAVARYREEISGDSAILEFANEIRDCATADAVSVVIERHIEEFEMFRQYGGKMKGLLGRIVKMLLQFSDAAGDAAAVSRSFCSLFVIGSADLSFFGRGVSQVGSLSYSLSLASLK